MRIYLVVFRDESVDVEVLPLLDADARVLLGRVVQGEGGQNDPEETQKTCI